MIELPPLGWDNDYEPLWRTWPPQKCGVKARETAEEMNEEGFMVMKPSLVGGLDYWYLNSVLLKMVIHSEFSHSKL